MQSKCNWEVMVVIGSNMYNWLPSFVTASAVGMKPTAFRDGLRWYKDY